jgi:3-hydroxyisobutyrate dehydrogenase/2-hydroxy-3-oxopropionate reductase
VAENADVIFLCVGTSEMSKSAILGENGLVHGLRPGSAVIDASTISPTVSREIGAALKAKGVDFLDAPCTGSTPGAEGGTLTFMIGGDQKVFEQNKPNFEPMGKRLYYCGGPGMGLQAKLTQNLILSNIMMAFNEGMVLATKGGVDPKLMLEILDNSAAKSGLISYKAPFIFRRDFEANFSTKWMHKDVGLMLDSGENLGVPLPLTSLTHQLFQTAISAGYGDEDFCSSIKVLEDLVGVEVKSS